MLTQLLEFDFLDGDDHTCNPYEPVSERDFLDFEEQLHEWEFLDDDKPLKTPSTSIPINREIAAALQRDFKMYGTSIITTPHTKQESNLQLIHGRNQTSTQLTRAANNKSRKSKTRQGNHKWSG